MNNTVFRIIDANLNRLREACRVIEDAHRFNGDPRKVAGKMKAVRHELAALALRLPTGSLLGSRDAALDAGQSSEGSGEYRRQDLVAVCAANCKRAQEAARVLEEAGKIVSEEFARGVEALRYRLYELEIDASLGRRFPKPCLYVLVTRALCRRPPEEVLRMVCAGGASMIQLREKEAEDGAFLAWIEAALKITEPYSVPVIINDRVHLAQLTATAGVHLGQGDLPTDKARRLLSPLQMIGRSTHALVEAKLAEQEGVDYIGVGPLYPTTTKEHCRSVGLEYLRDVQQAVALPYVAIGSVNRGTLPAVQALRPAGLAICTGIIAAEDPERETAYYLKELVAGQC